MIICQPVSVIFNIYFVVQWNQFLICTISYQGIHITTTHSYTEPVTKPYFRNTACRLERCYEAILCLHVPIYFVHQLRNINALKTVLEVLQNSLLCRVPCILHEHVFSFAPSNGKSTSEFATKHFLYDSTLKPSALQRISHSRTNNNVRLLLADYEADYVTKASDYAVQSNALRCEETKGDGSHGAR